jgi:hypothetical protein
MKCKHRKLILLENIILSNYKHREGYLDHVLTFICEIYIHTVIKRISDRNYEPIRYNS